MRDIHNSLKAVQTLDPAPSAETRYGAPVDGRGYQAVEHLVLIGAAGEALSQECAIACVLEASEDGSAWLPVTAAHDVLGAPPDEAGIFARVESVADDLSVCRTGYAGPARYTRVGVLFIGDHEEPTPVAALALLGGAHLKPVK
jgi:hypothetical protein